MRAVRIVDDDPVIAEMIGTLLSLESIPNAVTTDDFDMLLRPERWRGITHALVDINLSDPITGLDILRYLKENEPGIRRIVLSATSDYEPVPDGLADAVLVKPSEIGDIVREVRL